MVKRRLLRYVSVILRKIKRQIGSRQVEKIGDEQGEGHVLLAVMKTPGMAM